MSLRRITARRAAALALITASGVAANPLPAIADSNSSSFFLSIKPNAQLLPTLRAKEGLAFPEDGREYDYVTKGYFKVGGKTVARLSTITGHADRTGEHLTLTLKRSTRSTIRAAAKRHGTKRVILTLVHRITLTTNIQGDQAPRNETLTQQVPLRIPAH